WNKHPISSSLPSLVLALFFIPCILVVLQVSDFVPESWLHPLWKMAAESMDISVQPTISITPDESLVALMRLLSYGLVFFLIFQFCRNPHRASTVLKWLAIAGAFYALYGLIAYWGNIDIFFWSGKNITISKVSSTFINRNNYAIYAGLGLLCLIALLLTIVEQQTRWRDTPNEGYQRLIETYIYLSWLPLLGIMLIATALISTQSRGGSICSGIAIFILFIIILVRAESKMKLLLPSLGGVCLIFLMAYSISNEPLLKRIEQIELSDSERITVFKLTIDATKDNPLTGFGYGSFNQGFKIYRSEDVQYSYDKTHNTYLENSFEIGIPGAMSLVLTVLSLMIISLRGVIRRRRNWIYPAVGVAATFLVAGHSLIDFSLQIPAIAITYSTIMGLAVAQSYSSS
nr:O-antigen ligase family protein [Acidiferrobacterales bacterium]